MWVYRILDIAVLLGGMVCIFYGIKFVKEKYWNFVDYLFTFGVGILCLGNFIVGPCIVLGESMMPTLNDKQVLLVNKWDKEYKPGDIIVFYAPKLKEKLIKRVVGLEGDEIILAFGDVWKNGEIIKEDYERIPSKEFLDKYKVPKGKYFVLGDNRPYSNDSRYEEVGYLEKKHIIGKIIGK